MDVTSGSDTEINLSKGAEGSAVKTINEKKSVEVTNNTSSKVEITNEAGKNQTVESGKNATVDGSGNVTNSTTENGSTSGVGGSSSGGGSPSGGGDSSGGASSSGNLTRIISYFDTIPTITAGTSGETLKTVEQIKEVLPTEVSANDINGGKFNISVTDWVNENDYSENSSAGNYTFTAVLGSASVVYSNPDNKKATVRVHVNTNIGIELGDNDSLEVVHYTNGEKDANDENDVIEYYSIKNTSDKLIRVTGRLKCYDTNNYLVTTLSLYGWDRQYVHPGETGLFTVNYFGDLQYDRCYLDLSSSYEITHEEGESALSAVKVEGEKKADELSIKLTNTSERQISTVGVQILFLNENGEVYGWRSTSSNKVYGAGYTDTLNIKYPIKYWRDGNGTWQETVIEPSSFLIYIYQVHIS